MKYTTLLKNRNFVALWLGQITSEFGDRLNQMALVASVYYNMQGASVFRLVLILSFTIIPVFLIGPVAGVYIDRWDRKQAMIVCDILRALLVLLIPFFLINMKMFFPIYIVVFCIFSVTRFFLPAKLGLIPDIVSPQNLLLANSLTATSRLIATVLGLGLGGIIVAIVGVRSGFYIDSATYLASAFAILLIKVPRKSQAIKESILVHGKRIKDIEKTIFRDIAHSIRYIIHQKEIPYIMKTFFILMSGAGLIYVIFIDFIMKNIVTSPQIIEHLQRFIGFGQFGFIIILMGLGALAGALIFPKIGGRVSRVRAISAGFALSGLFLLVFSYATLLFKNFWITAILSIFLGMSAAPIMVVANTLFHEVTRNEMRGRIFSTLEIVIHLGFLACMFLSMFLVSVLKIPDVQILASAGLFFFIYGIAGWAKHRST